MNQAQLAKKQQQLAKETITEMLHWTEQQYCDFQFGTAYEYVKAMTDEQQCDLGELPHTADFWAWWRNQWFKIDAEFTRTAVQMSINERRRAYEWVHDAAGMPYQPQAAILEMGFKLKREKEIKA